MAVAVVLDVAGATLEQYDEVISNMGFDSGGRGAPGALFHWVTRTYDGIRVTDVWATRAEFDVFVRNRIGPITAADGVPESPARLTFREVYDYLTAG